MIKYDLTYTVGLKDSYGATYDDDILIHFNEDFIIKVNSLKELESIASQLLDIKKQIENGDAE